MISTFSPNCTFPDHSVNYVGAPPLRSTLNIVWPCVLTLIASIYSALHLDVMADEAATSATPCGCKWCKISKCNRVCRSVRSLSLSLSIAAVALFAPELIAQRAIMEWLEGDLNLWEELEPQIKTQWTRTHLYYVKMGAFRLRCLGPFSGHESSPCDCKETILDEGCLMLAMKCGLLPQEPPITSQEISDQSKASAFAKVIAIWQIGYFLADLVTRLARRLPVTQLEVGVAAFAMLAIVTLCAYFSKPKGVNIGTRVCFQLQSSLPEAQGQKRDPGSSEKTPESPEDQHMQREFEYLKGVLDIQGRNLRLRCSSFRRELMSQLFLDRYETDFETGAFLSMACAGVFALPFGAVHVAAWNSNFPSVADLWLWRISSLVSMIILLLGAAIVTCAEKLLKHFGHVCRASARSAALCSFVAVYTLARVILIVEMVRCMLFLFPEAFVTTWTVNVPHLG